MESKLINNNIINNPKNKIISDVKKITTKEIIINTNLIPINNESENEIIEKIFKNLENDNSLNDIEFEDEEDKQNVILFFNYLRQYYINCLNKEDIDFNLIITILEYGLIMYKDKEQIIIEFLRFFIKILEILNTDNDIILNKANDINLKNLIDNIKKGILFFSEYFCWYTRDDKYYHIPFKMTSYKFIINYFKWFTMKEIDLIFKEFEKI